MPVEKTADGGWQFTEWDNLNNVVKRPIIAPLYHFYGEIPYPYEALSYQEYNKWGNKYSGRVLVCDGGFNNDDRRAPQEYLTNLGPTDVVRFQLYEGGPSQHTRGRGVEDRVPAYEDNISMMRDVAPNVEGIIIGNCGTELAAHQWLPGSRNPETRQHNRNTVVSWMVDFIHRTGDIVKEAGGQPFWSPMDRELIIDCYHCDCRMAEAMAEYNAPMIIFQEGAFFPRWHCIYGNDGQDGRHIEVAERKADNLVQINQIQNEHKAGYTDWEARIIEWDEREVYPYRKLLDYFRKYRVWHCIGYDRHFVAAYDRLLQLHGVEVLVY